MATSNTEVAKQAAAGGSLQRAEQSAVVIRPPVDIYEDGDGITLQADLPGVSKERLSMRVENQSLIIEGQMQFDLPEQAEALRTSARVCIGVASSSVASWKRTRSRRTSRMAC